MTEAVGRRQQAGASAEPAGAGVLRFAAELSRATSVEELTELLYRGIGGVIDSVAVGFDLLDPATRTPRSTSGHGVSTFFLAKYDQVARQDDPVLRRAIDSRQLAYNLAMMSEAEWRGLRVYREVFSLHHMVGLVYVPVLVRGEVVATLNLARATAFTAAELAVAADLADLLGSLMASLQRREVLEHELGLYRDALDLVSEAVIISDVGRAARYLNKAAARVLDGQPDDAPSFDEAFIAAQNRDRQRTADAGLVQRSIALEGDIFVSFLCPASAADALPHWLRDILTSREADIVLLVAKGLHDAEIAGELRLSVHTVKSYLREIFKKTGARSRVELARMTLTAATE